MTVWRIVDPAYLSTAFSGIGAERYGGRFNSKGRRAVYAAGSISLAMLEMLVQANKRRRLIGHLCISATFDDSQVETLKADELPDGWDARPYMRMSQDVGDAWLDEGRALVLRVPSVVIPQEYNYVINPLHSEAGLIKVGTPFPAPFDTRLVEGMP